MKNTINLFCHRGLYGCTDVNQTFLKMPYAKGKSLKDLPPENSYSSIKAAFDSGYGVELDICMTKDNVLIVTHTNHLPVHVKNAQNTDYVSTTSFKDIMALRTGIGGRTEPFLTYQQFLDLFQNYPHLPVNIEIKGTIEQEEPLSPQTNPSLVEQLSNLTPEKFKEQIIWSSFSTQMISNFKKLNPQAKVAQLFCEPKATEPLIFKTGTDRYLQFNLKNIKMLLQRITLEAVHVEISTLNDDEVLSFCVKNNIHIRTWALLESNPNKDKNALHHIRKVQALIQKYPNLKLDIITDYAPIVKKILGMKV